MGGTTIAIVGGGFCGTLAAIRLLTSPPDGRPSLPSGSRIVLIEPARPGQGLAYRAGPDYWRLNVPAQRMSAFNERPADFLHWARARNSGLRADEFLPRAWYGDYLADRLELARRGSSPSVSFEHLRNRAIGIRARDSGVEIALDDGAILHADRVLLALGNSPTAGAVPGIAPGDTVADAWNPDWIENLPREAPRVLLIGTGLTMIDIALRVAAARPDARMLAISRHGLLPLPHSDTPLVHDPVPFAVGSALSHGPLYRRLRTFRQFTHSWTAGGGDWRAVLQAVREEMAELWQPLPRKARAQFLRHLRSWWDVHRHRVPSWTMARINDLRHDKHLQIEAGRLLGAQRVGNRLAVTWRRRGSTAQVEEQVDAVVNVTGPDSDPRRSTCPLVRSLHAQKLCRPDALGLGWDTDTDGRLLEADGTPSRTLFYVGPSLRGRLWEATAVPELRRHVDRTTEALTASLTPEHCVAPA